MLQEMREGDPKAAEELLSHVYRDLLALDEALTKLAESEPEAAGLVKILYFVRLTQEQAATALGVSISTIERRWAYARAWLFREIQKGRNPLS
ncbi:MAG TPA: ECF-type sigma factor [Verrucomicrobiae bacterium]